MRRERDRPGQRIGFGGQRPVQIEIEPVVARLALDIIDVDMDLRTVAEIEEAGQGGGDDDRIAHDHRRLGRADL